MATHKSFNTIISSKELAGILLEPETKIIDCRFDLGNTEWGLNEFMKGHIPGAVYAHLDKDLSGKIIPEVTGRHPLPDFRRFVHRVGYWGIKPQDLVVCYDQGPGAIAARAWWLLKWIGHQSVAVLDGGWAAWTKQKLPQSSRVDIPDSIEYPVRSGGMPIVQADDILTAVQLGEIILLDSRSPDRYAGKEEPIDPVAGHIPGAANMPFADNVTTEGYWKSPEELNKRFLPVASEKKPVFYCGSGVTACHNILAYAHAGLGDAALYPGSWSEWITNADRPVASIDLEDL